MARDDYDDRPVTGAPSGGMDGFFGNMVVTVIFALIGVFCCPLISAILGGIGVATCRNPGSKRNAMIVLVAGIIGIVLNIILFATGAVDYRAQFNQAR